MRLTTFLLGRGEQYERLDRVSIVQGDGSGGEGIELYESSESISKVQEDVSVCEGGNDREFLLFKTQEDGQLRDEAMVAAPEHSGTKHFHVTMTLVIRKMDDTSFEVELSTGALLSDLKEAIQKKFQHKGREVSWQHVWGHFCLSFRDQKLLEDQLPLHQLGIGDSDELAFVRHLDTRASKDGQPWGFLSSLRKKLTSY